MKLSDRGMMVSLVADEAQQLYSTDIPTAALLRRAAPHHHLRLRC